MLRTVTLLPLYAENLEIPLPQTPRNLRASPGLYRASFTYETSIYALILQVIASFVQQSFFWHLQLADTETTAIEVTDTQDTPTVEKPGCSETPQGDHTCYDCTTAPICIKLQSGLYYNAGPINCDEMNPNTPYCTNGECSNKASDKCKTGPPISKFVCTSSGYFPDPDDCRKFYFCVKDTATEYSCPTDYVYSHQKNSCVRQTVSSDCAVINCKYESVMEYVVYPKDPKVYGLCIRDQPTVMFKCDEEEEFDTKTSKCIYVCTKAGLFPVPKCQRKYRECVSVGAGNIELYERECPDGSIFDPVKEKCVVIRRAVTVRRRK